MVTITWAWPTFTHFEVASSLREDGEYSLICSNRPLWHFFSGFSREIWRNARFGDVVVVKFDEIVRFGEVVKFDEIVRFGEVVKFGEIVRFGDVVVVKFGDIARFDDAAHKEQGGANNSR